MNAHNGKPVITVHSNKEKSLSGPGLSVLMRAVADKGYPFRFKAKGFSMSPIIKDGDIITVHSLKNKRIGVGDVAAISQPIHEKILVHRLIDRKCGFFIAQGDNNPETDEAVSPERIIGKVNSIERNGRKKYLGLGPERFVIAWMMRKKIFLPFIHKSRSIHRIMNLKKNPQH